MDPLLVTQQQESHLIVGLTATVFICDNALNLRATNLLLLNKGPRPSPHIGVATTTVNTCVDCVFTTRVYSSSTGPRK